MKKLFNLFFSLMVMGFFHEIRSQDLMIQPFKTIDNFEDNILQINFSPKSTFLSLTLVNGNTKMYDKDFNEIWNYQGSMRVGGSVTAFAPDEKFMAFGKYFSYGDVVVLNLADKKIVQRLKAFESYLNTLVISPDGKYMLAGGDDKFIKQWKWNDKELKFEVLPDLPLTKHSGSPSVNEMAFSPDGKYLVAVGMNGINEIAIFERQKEGYTQIQSIEDSFYGYSVDFDPSGKYIVVGTSEHARCLKLDKNKFVEVGKTEMGNGTMSGSDFDKTGNFFVTTQYNGFKIFNFKDGILTKNDWIEMHDRSVGMDVKFSPDKNYLLSTATDRKLIIWQMPDAPIKSQAKHDKGEHDKRIDNKLKEEEDKRKGKDNPTNEHDLEFDVSKTGKNYLLIVGINEYKFWNPLGNATKDAKEVKKVLTERYRFVSENIFEIYDKEATVKNILAKISELRSQIKEDDNLLIYFSGHGFYNPDIDEGFWIPVDAKKGEETEYLANSTLLKYLKSIQAKHIFLVADACFSGALFSQGSRGYVENVEQFKSRWGLTSGRLEYVSDGDTGKNSPFATYFIKFLKDNQKTKFPISELVQYVKTAVANNSDQTPIGNPLKSIGDEGGEFVFYLK